MPSALPKILLVDDSPLVHEFVRLALVDGEGWEVVGLGSGAEALARVAAEPFDAALVDVEMPGLDGPTTVTAVRATTHGRGLPVLFLTAHDSPEQTARLTALDVAGIVAKPFQIDALAGAIRARLGWAT